MSRIRSENPAVKSTLLPLLVLGCGLFSSQETLAQQDLITIQQTVTIPSECRMTITGDMTFGAINPLTTSNFASSGVVISFSCTRGTPTPSIYVSQGSHYVPGSCTAGVANFRRMKNSAQNTYLKYEMQAWLDADFGNGTNVLYAPICTNMPTWALMDVSSRFGNHNPATSDPDVLHNIYIRATIHFSETTLKTATPGAYTDYVTISMNY